MLNTDGTEVIIVDTGAQLRKVDKLPQSVKVAADALSTANQVS